MGAGRYRHRITIESSSAVLNGFGEETLTWSTYMTAWAAIEPLRGREYMEAKQVQADVDTRIRLRGQASKTIQPSMRVKFGARIYEIVSPPINVSEIGKEVQLMCREQIDG